MVNDYDASVSIFDNLFNKRKKKPKQDDEDVVDDHNEYLTNLGMD